MKVVITGATGFVGRALLDSAVNGASMDAPTRSGGMEVVALVRSEASKGELSAAFPMIRVECTQGLHHEGLVQVLEGADAVVHLAWSTVPLSANSDPVADLDANVTAGLRLLEASGAAGIRRFIFVSSGGTLYGPGTAHVPHTEHTPVQMMGAYGAGKFCLEEYIRLRAGHHGFEYVILRLGNLYGRVDRRPREQGVIEQWMDKLAVGDAIEVWNGLDVVRDYVHIDDMVAALQAVIANPVVPPVLNVGSGHGTSLRELSELLARVTGRVVSFRVKGQVAPVIPWNVLDPSLLRTTVGVRPGPCSEDRLRALWSARHPGLK